MYRVVSSISVLLLLTTVFFPTIAAANEPPLADAGLDQHVARGSTVLLDASGSHDPDGRIERYEWSIRTPDGRTITPNCRTCPQTRFHPNEVGRYAVSLTVTDEDGT
ncbi:PKD domain-containing protein, partial [Haladaptatus sp.]|uniref:PKD domain-containing protein n=1 Tax=Haladaptatus sp. TaxID=1973141 RepID=UPI003C5240EF